MSDVSVVVRAYEDGDRDAVIALWHESELVADYNHPENDIERKKLVHGDLFLVAEVEGSIAGAVMGGYDGHRGSVSYLGVLPGMQKLGIGRALMDELAERLRAMGCPKINLLVRDDNRKVVGFYEAIGYEEYPVIFMSKRLIEE